MINVYEYKHRNYSVYKPADESHPSTGFYLTKEEYENLIRELRLAKYMQSEAETKLEDLKESHELEIKELIEKFNSEYKLACQNAEAEIQEQLHKEQSAKMRYQQIAKTESELNRNFKRIARERANKNRKINKNEPGYLFISWNPFTYQLKNNGSSSSVPLFTVNIQTPWDCSFSLEEVDRLVLSDVYHKNLILSKDLAVEFYIENISLDEALQSEDNIDKLILTRKYRSNVKSGLWEVTFITGFEPIVVEKHRIKYV